MRDNIAVYVMPKWLNIVIHLAAAGVSVAGAVTKNPALTAAGSVVNAITPSPIPTNPNAPGAAPNWLNATLNVAVAGTAIAGTLTKNPSLVAAAAALQALMPSPLMNPEATANGVK